MVHKLVMAAFVGPVPSGHEVNHKDGIKSNNCLDNLEYLTPPENVQHAFRTGLMPSRKGVHNGRAQITEDDVRAIRASTLSNKALTTFYPLTDVAISKIRRYKTWAEVS